MATPLPDGPFCIPDETPICGPGGRVDTLDELATQGVSSPTLQTAARRVKAAADIRCAAATSMATRDPAFARALSRQNGCARIVALEALRYAQSVPYVANPNGKDCYQGVDWTIAHGGECKAKSVLFVSLCRALGLEAEPWWITQNGAPLNHVTARVKLDGAWLWADGSIKRAALGESPYEALGRLDHAKQVLGIAPAGRGGGGGGHGGSGHGVSGGRGGEGFRSGGFFGGRSVPFSWWGWDGLWSGWPYSWWCYYYPYLCTGLDDGFYNVSPVHVPGFVSPAADAIAPAGCPCTQRRSVALWGRPVAVIGTRIVEESAVPATQENDPYDFYTWLR